MNCFVMDTSATGENMIHLCIESRKTNNLITLYEQCHDDYRSDRLKLKLKRGQSFRDTAFIAIIR